ncbi:MAG: isoprenylcysteine carboxylmethyltransferase family protein [Acidobacteriota bacterium]
MTSVAPGGAWLFRYRSYLPVPLALVLLFVRKGAVDATWVPIAGALLVATGEGLRLWAVRHIGTISRTRTTRYGPLMTAGPYAVVRNPLYVGNWFLWSGFAIWSGLLWMLPVAWLVFGVQYRAIARWEAAFIRGIYTTDYDAYARRVRAWIPRWPAQAAPSPAPLHPWAEVLFSERGTLIAVGVMAALLVLKQTRAI